MIIMDDSIVLIQANNNKKKKKQERISQPRDDVHDVEVLPHEPRPARCGQLGHHVAPAQYKEI